MTELDEEGRILFEHWQHASDALDYWKTQKDQLAEALAARLGEDNKATIDGRHVATWYPPTTRSRFDEKRFHQHDPDTWAAFLVPQTFRGYLRRPPARKAAG